MRAIMMLANSTQSRPRIRRVPDLDQFRSELR
jgi:hypothetical protein